MAIKTDANDRDGTSMEARVRSFAQEYNLTFGEAMEKLCRIGLSAYEAIGGELSDLAGSAAQGQSPAASAQAAPRTKTADEPAGAERRGHPRIPTQFLAQGKVQGPGGEWSSVSGEVTNVSMRGLLFAMTEDQTVASGAHIKLYLPKMGVETVGKVRHIGTDKAGDTILDVGVELTNMTREHWLRWLELLAR